MLMASQHAGFTQWRNYCYGREQASTQLLMQTGSQLSGNLGRTYGKLQTHETTGLE